MIKGNISSIETLGTLDGPGIRFVVFLQGCKLRCKYCHNPETWQIKTSNLTLTPNELVDKILRYKNYFKNGGGVTFSGGEPLLQPEFLLECLKLCKMNGIHTCLDTAGVGFGDYDEIFKYTDLIILDIKAVDSDEYTELTGQKNDVFLNFLSQVIKHNKKLWLRQVVVPTINDDKSHILKLKEFIKGIPNVEKVELLPYKTIGVHKYTDLNLPYRLDGIPELSEQKLTELNLILNNNLT